MSQIVMVKASTSPPKTLCSTKSQNQSVGLFAYSYSAQSPSGPLLLLLLLIRATKDDLSKQN